MVGRFSHIHELVRFFSQKSENNLFILQILMLGLLYGIKYVSVNVDTNVLSPNNS